MLSRPEADLAVGSSDEHWVDYNFFGHQLVFSKNIFIVFK